MVTFKRQTAPAEKQLPPALAKSLQPSHTETTVGEAESKPETADRVAGTSGSNVATVERWVSGVAGAALLANAVARGSYLGRLLVGSLGAALLHRAATGHCYVYEMLGVNTKCWESGQTGPCEPGAERPLFEDGSVDVVHEASEASFPASDSPGWSQRNETKVSA